MIKSKYHRIISSVIDDIRLKRLQQGDPLPSINIASRKYGVARETVVKAYSKLNEKGILEPVSTKGFFVRSENIQEIFRVFILFDALTAYKEDLFSGLKDGFGKKVDLDIYFHHFNSRIYADLVHQSKGKYHYYILTTWPDNLVAETLSTIDQDKMIILDRDLDFPGKKCSVLHQDFGREMTRVMTENWDRFSRYDFLTLVFPPPDRFHPLDIRSSFKNMCISKKVKYSVVEKLHPDNIKKGTVYLIIEDNDLVTLFECMRERGWRPGKDVGVVSYNNTALKKIIEGGVTVLSTDFYNLGRRTAHIVLNGKKVNEVFPSQLSSSKLTSWVMSTTKGINPHTWVTSPG